MNRIGQRSEDTAGAAMLAGFWAGIVINKVDSYALTLNLPVVHSVMQLWPLVLIASGVVLLVRYRLKPASRPANSNVVTMAVRDVQLVNRTAKEQAHAR